MPQPHLRTRSKKRVKVPLSSGRSSIHYKKEKTSAASCFKCGRPITGMARLTTVEVRKLNRSKRRIWRSYGGSLCHNCLKYALKQTARTL